jgi:cytochrome oxidase Cu insertion factor (SCO1/SenC/PrrC family)
VRTAVLLAALVAALAIPAGVLLARGGEETDFRGSEPPAGLTLPPFELRDETKRPVSSAGLRGKVLAVTFLDTECTEACPIIAAQMAQAMRALGDEQERITAIAITADPVGDTQARIRAFLGRYRAKGLVHYLDGSVAELRPVWRGFKVASSLDSGDSNMHSAPVRVYDGEGHWRSTLHAGVDLTATNLAHDLRLALE